MLLQKVQTKDKLLYRMLHVSRLFLHVRPVRGSSAVIISQVSQTPWYDAIQEGALSTCCYITHVKVLLCNIAQFSCMTTSPNKSHQQSI